MIRDRTGLHANAVRLAYLGKELSSAKSLSDYQIPKGAKLQLINSFSKDNEAVVMTLSISCNTQYLLGYQQWR